jgi:hypothetical protein
MVEEARLEQLDAGLTPVTEGWFVVNVRDAAWVTSESFGDACTLEGEGTPPFGEIGLTLGVLQPGRPSALYHRESNQEDFLVLAGECLLLRGRGAATQGVGLRPLPAGDRPHLRRRRRRPVPDLHVWRADGREADHVPALGARAPPRRGRRERHERAAGGVRALPEVAAGAAGELGRPALGLARASEATFTSRLESCGDPVRRASLSGRPCLRGLGERSNQCRRGL